MKKIGMLPVIDSLEYNKGGQHTVVKKLYLSTELQKDVAFYLIPKKNDNIENLKKYGLLMAIKKTSLGLIMAFSRLMRASYKHIKTLDHEVIISHDYIDSYVITKFFKNIRLVTVQHSQGSLYTEYTDLHGYKKSFLLKWFLNHMEKTIYKNAEITGFPSMGAREALMQTHPQIKGILEQKPVAVLYNGVPIKNEQFQIEKPDKPLQIITVSKINMAKGIDRVPEYLNQLKERNINFHWTLLGQGPLADILEQEIEKYSLQNHITWIKDRLPHATVMEYLTNSHYYMCMHRFSIFDFSTLEAMLHGCIPLLTNVGGNKEMIQWNNGVLIDEKEQFAAQFETIEQQRDTLAKENFEIVKNNFSESNFYNYYIDLVKRIR
ncbi:glycosyltransferase family 4 protein [Neptunitalea lumnitzerae]|uniref:Glycosyl transferase family 1 domain-containing protein n=1 Tax=Neptunitalea lumnitzerae TaxID=2965509 RepID=A0ABQ5MFI0_9FLAO|nr:glycosyltransferase family 4 protein [Neptunitalea sp. Y10]GLB48138.1 hypothetical protein Y10_05060 [Neptunitalea sp. Y10]